MVGLISNNNETHYREEVAQLAEWCGANNLSLNVSKTKEVVMDFRWNSGDHPPLAIDSSNVERVSSTKFLGVHIKENLTWTPNTTSLSKKVQQHLHFLCLPIQTPYLLKHGPSHPHPPKHPPTLPHHRKNSEMSISTSVSRLVCL